MDRRRWIRIRRASALLLAVLWPAAMARAGDRPRPTGRITRYDLATRGELLLSHLVAPSVRGDVADWPVLAGLSGQVGDWSARYFDARRMAGVLVEAFPVEGQPALASVDRVVAGCAATLGLEKPAVHVRAGAEARIYAVEAGGACHLVLTSGLLDLFEGRPGELAFAVGRELGRVKCGQLELRRKSYALLWAVRAIDAAAVPDRYRDVLPSLALGRLFGWSREAEFSADRAGVLCCGEPRVAYEAIMRLQHGLRAGSGWIDPEAPGFDAGTVVASFREWQDRPLMAFVLHLQGQAPDQPYYQDRLAMLKLWCDSGGHRALLGRVEDAEESLVEVTRIVAYELAAEGETVDPYVVVGDGTRPMLRTRHATGVRSGEWKGLAGAGTAADQPRSLGSGQPLFFEIWDSNYFGDTLVGGFAVYPSAADAVTDGGGDRVAEYTAPIRWDWRESRTISRPGYARVCVRFTGRPARGVAGAVGEAGR